MKKLKLELGKLEVQSFVTLLTDVEQRSILGGDLIEAVTDYTGVTSKCNPKTNESNVVTCCYEDGKTC